MSNEETPWLDKEFIRKSIQNCEKDDGTITLTSYQTSSVVPPGNNYGSCLYRVQAEYLDSTSPGVKTIYLIVKSPLTTGKVKALFEDFVSVEFTFYNKFVPLASKFLPNYCFAPKTYFSPIPNVNVLEDLKASGYVMPDRCKQLDFDQCRLYTTSSATLHAVSVAVHHEQPQLVESLGGVKLFSNELKSVEPLKLIILNGLRRMALEMDKIEEYQQYAKTIGSSPAAIWDMAVEAHKKSSALNALQQGDPWSTNMMFKYDEAGQVVDIRLLDFQMLLYSSPLNDLTFFIWTSANNDVRDSKLQDLFHLYCDTFNSKLEECGCSERLSYDEMLEHMKLLSPVALAVSAAFLPFMINEKPMDYALLVKGINSGDKRGVFGEYYNKEYCDNILPSLLRQLKKQGVFDYIESKIGNTQCTSKM